MSDTSLKSADDRASLPGARAQSVSRFISQARLALRRFLYEEAVACCEAALELPRLRPDEEATVRCLLAEANESLAQFTEAVKAVSVYEQAEARARLSAALQSQVCLRLGAAYGGTVEIPQALSYARQALALAEECGDTAAGGACHLLLGHLYRRLGETHFASGHYAEARKLAQRAGNELIQGQALNGIGLVYLTESNQAGARQAFEQARRLLPADAAPLLHGSLNINQAIGPALQGQWRESVELLEQAVPLLERARQPRLIANARSNLGYSLLRLGELQRAEASLVQAQAEAHACEALLVEASTMESRGEIRFIQGDFAAAESLLLESLKILHAIRVGFNEAQAFITLGRCRLLAGQAAQAEEAFRTSLEICQRMGDPRGQASASLWLIESCLATGKQQEAQNLYAAARAEIERLANKPLLAHLKEITGHLALAAGDAAAASRHFNRAITLWQMMDECWRSASAGYHFGQACLRAGDTAQALAALEQARAALVRMGERPMLARIEKLLGAIPASATASLPERALSARIVAALTRLHEAADSRDLLLPELLHVFHEDFAATPVIIFQQTPGAAPRPLLYKGCDHEQAEHLARMMADKDQSVAGELRELFISDEERLLIYPGRRGDELSDSLIDLLLRQAATGLERAEWQPRPARIAPESGSSLVSQLTLPGFVCHSETMRRIVEQVYSLRTSDIPVLLIGETGTGKDLIARAIHTLSSRSAHPFIPFNCAATPRELIESQLFGHRRGAYTGARTDFPGVIGAAEKGTLFLDEISELSREVQPKLLRFLQNGEIHRLGETSPRQADVRVIAASNRDLKAMVEAGEFRADLYYRLNVISFHLPPLRERRDEIQLLADHFLRRYQELADRQGITLTPAVSELLRRYEWPGNARELENEIRRVVALAHSGERVTADKLSPHISRQPDLRLVRPKHRTARTLPAILAETEREIISEALVRLKGNLSKVADELGVSRNGLRKMIVRLNLDRFGGVR